MTDRLQFRVGAVTLTRVPYFDIALPPSAVALTEADVAAVSWATPTWCDTPSAVRVGQAFWVIESMGQTIVVDPCCASDAFLRTGADALTHQEAAFAAFRAAGFEPDTVDTVIMSHLDGIGMNALVDPSGRWRRAFTNAPILVSTLESDRIATRDGISGADAFNALMANHTIETVTLPHSVTPEVTMVLSGGHTPGHATVVVESAGNRALFLGHLSVNPVHAGVDTEVVLHDDPALGTAALRRWLVDAATDDALVIGPLWPAPGAARVVGVDPVVLVPAVTNIGAARD